MEREDLISQLKILLAKIERVEAAEEYLKEASSKLDSAMARRLTKVYDFDRANKERYIEEKIGPVPEKPKGIIKLAVPVYLSKKKAYDKSYSEYIERYDKTEEQYYSEFADRRSELDSEDRAAITYDIQTAKKGKAEAVAERDAAQMDLVADTLLSDKMKTKEAVLNMIEYVQDQRADSVKEAVNLYFEEQHRRALEAFAEEQIRLTEEAKEFARQAAESASEAAACASEAASDAQEALERADAAYNRANEAYSEAQDAYFAANN